jgi:galactokinase/mevalonate kinase-like predicted kinase
MGKAMTASFRAQCQLFPLMTNEKAEAILSPIESDILGYKISGAGGGGYWVVVSEFKMDSFISIKIRR